jgi:hypothetical protein
MFVEMPMKKYYTNKTGSVVNEKEEESKICRKRR